ncbi:MAG: ABC transporter transmembrane domain-containing protein [Alphaproteobacteria bacterium]
MKEKTAKKSINIRKFLELIPYFKPYKKEVAFALLALLVTALMVLLFGKGIKYLIDFGFAVQDNIALTLVLVLFIIAIGVMSVAGYYRSYLINSASERVIADLRKKIYNHILHVSAEFFEITKAGDVVSRLTVDTTIIYNVLSNTISFLLRNLILFFGGLIFLFFTSFKLSVISILLIIIAIMPIFVLGKIVKNLSLKSQTGIAQVSAHIEESVNGIKTIQSYICEEKEARNFANFVDNSLQSSLEKIKIKSLMVAMVICLAFGSIAIVLFVGGHDVLSKKITSGDLSSFIFYSIISATSLVALSQIAGQLQSASASLERVFELLKISSPVYEKASPEIWQNSKNIEINFVNIGFSYPSRPDFAVIKNFNLKILAGQKIAIVGSSGSGKSTLLQLLLRFYDVNSGAIFINNIDIRDLNFKDLRQNFAYISQDCFIFSGTIYENIAYVDKSITKSEVEKIINENSALNFIKNLPDGMDSFVGEKGIKLSGGERQRLAFARAIIKDSPILLLDEATSALDNENEQFLQKALLNYAKDKTVITIAHKLSSIINVDKIIFVKDGEIVEIGTHQELIKNDSENSGFYKKMYEIELAQS